MKPVILGFAIAFLLLAFVLIVYADTRIAIWITDHAHIGIAAHPARERRVGTLCLSIGIGLLLYQWLKS
jgi:hypothetical protein